MRKLKLFWIQATCCAGLLMPAAHAATIFDVAGVFQSGAVMRGTITLDTVTGMSVAADVFLSAPETNQFTVIQAQYSPGPGVTILQLSPVAIGIPQLILAFPVADFIGYTGSVLCAPFGPCGGSSNLAASSTVDVLVFGTMTPQPAAAVAPEPGAAWLFGGGLALIGAARVRTSRGRRTTPRTQVRPASVFCPVP